MAHSQKSCDKDITVPIFFSIKYKKVKYVDQDHMAKNDKSIELQSMVF